jgi:hypothetical protein
MRKLIVGAFALVVLVGASSCSAGGDGGAGAAGPTPGQSVVIASGTDFIATDASVDKGPYDVSAYTELALYAAGPCNSGADYLLQVMPGGALVEVPQTSNARTWAAPATSVVVRVGAGASGSCNWQLIGQADG